MRGLVLAVMLAGTHQYQVGCDLGSSRAASLSVTSPSERSFVNFTNQSTVIFAGTCSAHNAVVVLSGSISAIATCSDSTWNVEVDFTSVPDGPITVAAAHQGTQVTDR